MGKLEQKRKPYKAKKEMARNMMTAEEISDHTPIFQSKAWRLRKEMRKKHGEPITEVKTEIKEIPIIPDFIPAVKPDKKSRLVYILIAIFIIAFWSGVYYLIKFLIR